MVKRKYGLVIGLLFVCLCLLLTPVRAADEPIDPARAGVLAITYQYDGVSYPDMQVDLFRIATVDANARYTLTEQFAPSGLIVNDIRTTGEWNVIRQTLEAYIWANTPAPDVTGTTGLGGQIFFSDLTPGLYLAIPVQTDLSCSFVSALVALPGRGADGHWIYQVAVTAKAEALPPIEPDEELQLQVVKLWKGDEGKKTRPQSIQIEIFREGVSQEIVTLSEETQWSYSWTAKDDGATWAVMEKNVPAGYTMTVENREHTFVVTNTYDQPQPDQPPKTGDSFNVMLYLILMMVSGSMLIILAIAGKRNSHEK